MTASIPSASSVYEPALDSGYVPDPLIRMGVRALLARRLNSLEHPSVATADQIKSAYIARLKAEKDIAVHTKDANEQHYEVPTDFFKFSLGERLKYSSCLFETPDGATGGNEIRSLEDAETAMLDLYVKRADVRDGQRILDLGCGWGSLTLYLAEKFPKATIVSLSNSASQREHIEAEAKEFGYSNIIVYTGDVSEFDFSGKEPEFDRVLSIEMFEHMKNYQSLLAKISQWLVRDTGRLFVHVFAHKSMPYDFRTDDDNSWMAKYFFTGGTMPSQDLLLWFQRDLEVLDRWSVNGKNYAKTSEEWLKRMDSNKQEILPIFAKTYGGEEQARIWFNRWRIFYIAVAETFAYHDGEEWFVVHYLFKRKN